MFQTDQPTAVSALPSPSAALTQGYFTNGNPGTGLAATVVDADFLNMSMLELTNVVLAAGLVPSKTTYNQLVTAIRILIQSGGANYGLDIGTVNAYAATFAATVLAVTDGEVLAFKASHANTGASTFTPNPGVIAPMPIWGGNNAALIGGEILANNYVSLEWNSTFGAWILLDSTGGAQQVGAGSYGVDPPALDRTQKLATTRWTLRNVYRVGEVKTWHGAVANIAAVWGPGWQLADGTNGTADLRNRFVVGAGATYAPNATGGTATLTIATVNMPAHNHVINIGDGGHAHGVSDPTHNHGISQSPHGHGVSDPGHSHAPGSGGLFAAQTGGGGPNGLGGGGQGYYFPGTTNAVGTGIGIFAQNANVSNLASGTGIAIFASGSNISANSNNTGSGSPLASLPPYYAMCFIEYTGIGA